MGIQHRAWQGSLMVVAMLLAGCGGSAPTAPPVNPYASGGGTSVATAPPANPAPVTPTPTAPSNPFGGPTPTTPPAPAPAPATSPFGAPAGTATQPATANPSPTKPGMTSPAVKPPTVASTLPAAKPKAKTPEQPAAEEPESPSVAADDPPEKEMPQEPGEEPEKRKSPSNVGFGGVAKKGTQSAQPEDAETEPTAPPADSPDEPAGETTEKGSWSLAADPAPAGSFAGAGAKLGLKMPSLGAFGPDFVESTRLRVLYPSTPSAFVALGLNDEKKQFREVWNLVDKKKLGQVRNLEFGSSKGQALSPDGKYLAGKPQWDGTISIFGVTQNKPLSPIKLSGNSSKLLAFAGKTRLVFEDNKELHVYSVPDFKPKTVVKLGAWKVDDGWAMSPGGRYFVAITRSGATAGMIVFDLDTGGTAATIPLTGQSECLGAAFSVNGQQLAVLHGGDSPLLKIWQVKTGASAGQFDLQEFAEQMTPRENYQGTRLEWFPDHRHLLIGGKAVFDSREGELVTALETQPIYPVRVVSPNQLAVAGEGKLGSYDLAEFFQAKTPEPEKTGTPETSTPLAEAHPVDRTAVTQITLEEVDWNVRPGKPPVPIKATGRGVEIPQGAIYMGCLSQSPHGIGFVMYTSQALGVSDEGLPTAEPGTRVWLEPLDLKNGGKQKSVPLPSLSVLMSVSPDGTLVCTQNADGLDRLDIWATRDGSHKGGLAPYHDASPGPDQRVAYAEFIDPFTLLTSAAGRLTLWDLGTNKAIYEVEIGEMRPELTPARDYVAVTDAGQRKIYLLETKTGKVAGSVVLSDLAGDLASTCGFHPEGRFFAAITRRIDGGELRVIDLNDGSVKKQVPLPLSAMVLQWVGSDYLLIDGSSLVSISRECIVWNYDLPDGMHLRDSPDQRHWFIAADPARSNVYTVRGVDMPDETVVQRIGASNPRGKLLLQPGQGLDLDVKVADPEGETGFSDQVKDLLADRYQSARIKVIPGVPVVMRVRDNSDDSGWNVSLLHEGKPIWSHEIDGADGPSALLDFEPPKFAFPAGSTAGAGHSALGVRGTK